MNIRKWQDKKNRRILYVRDLNEALGAVFVRQLQGDFIADYSIWPLIKPRVLRIVPRPVYCVWE